MNSLVTVINQHMPITTESYTAGSQGTGLVIVDEVNGFATIGAGNLAPQNANQQVETMISETNRIAKKFEKQKRPILAFLDTHTPGKPEPPYPPHCEEGTGEENFIPELEWLETAHQKSTRPSAARGNVDRHVSDIGLGSPRNRLHGEHMFPENWW